MDITESSGSSISLSSIPLKEVEELSSGSNDLAERFAMVSMNGNKNNVYDFYARLCCFVSNC